MAASNMERKGRGKGIVYEEELYCICRTSDTSRTMIGCDECDEWYHMDCLGLNPKDYQNDNEYYCFQCVEANPSLKCKNKPGATSFGLGEEEEKTETPVPTRHDNAWEGTMLRESRGGTGRSKTKTSVSGKAKESGKGGTFDADSSKTRSYAKNVSRKGDRSRGRGKKDKDITPRKRQSSSAKKSDDLSVDSADENECDERRKCFYWECNNSPRPGSKYCSDECGVKLAMARILTIIPGKVSQWNGSPSVAEQKNLKELSEVREEQQKCKEVITELEARRVALDTYIECFQDVEIDPSSEVHEVEEEGTLSCVTCGQEVPMKTSLKHMERCFNKYEIQSSFASAFKSKIEGTPIFCDFYYEKEKLYCKRLKVMCPEHSKPPKVRNNVICGSPVSSGIGKTVTADEVCKLAKAKCNRHHCWEKLRRAELDLAKVQKYLKLEELMKRENELREALYNRANILAMLLHSTTDHDENLNERFSDMKMTPEDAKSLFKNMGKENKKTREELLEKIYPSHPSSVYSKIDTQQTNEKLQEKSCPTSTKTGEILEIDLTCCDDDETADEKTNKREHAKKKKEERREGRKEVGELGAAKGASSKETDELKRQKRKRSHSSSKRCET